MLRPRAVDDAGFTVEPIRSAGGFVVRGEKPERWVRQTDFDNDEAVGYLADRLARLGVEDELAELGAEPGAAVTIGERHLRLRAQRRHRRRLRPGPPRHRRAARRRSRRRRRPTSGCAAKRARRAGRTTDDAVDGMNADARSESGAIAAAAGRWSRSARRR